MRSVGDIGDELYALPPADFTAARDTFVAEARQAGDRESAGEIAAMKRPSVSAWLVNLLALRDPDVVTELIDLGASIRDAQGVVPPQQLRDLSARRRTALDAGVARAVALARQAGAADPSRQHTTEAESTLSAAMADESVADLVRSGRVVKPVSYSGFGLEGLGGFGPVARAGAPARKPAPSRERTGGSDAKAPDAKAALAEREARASAERRQAAEAKLAEAGQRYDAALAAERAASALTDRLTADINDLRERLEIAQRDARLARQHRMAAERDVAAAQRRLDRAG